MAFFSYLTPADEIYPGKTISFLPDGKVQQVRPAPSSTVYADRYDFNNFDEMSEALFKMVEDGRGYLVRGQVLPEYVGTRRAFKRRLGKLGDGSVLTSYDPQWLCLDIDGLPKPEHIDPIERPEEAIAFLMESLPPYFHGVSCWWQFSSTQSLPGNRDILKAHLFYMLTNPIPEKKLKEWAKANKGKHYIDPSVMSSNQPVYIAPPKILGGRDWLKVRCGIYRGDADILDLNLFVTRTFNKDSRVIPIDQRKIISKHLAGKIGDGEGRDGFNDPIKSAIAAVIAKAGPEIDRDQLKADLRTFIKEAPTYDNRTGRQRDEYMEDSYLDPLIEALLVREGESRKVSFNQYQVARARFVYITNINRFYDCISGNYVSKEALNMALAKIGRSMGDVFVNDEDFIVVDQLTYFPGRERVCTEESLETGEKALCFNIYQPPRIQDEPAERAAFFIEHVRKLAGDDTVFKHMMDWLAFNVQQPGHKIMYAMLIQGQQGTGKSALMEAMKKCLGEQNVRSVETHEILGQFTSWMKGRSMVVAEEIRDSTERFAVYNRLKPVITGPTITLNEKNIPSTPMRNRVNVMAFTNYETAVPMDDDDRRFFVHFSPMEPQSEEYYNELFGVINNHAGAVRRALLEWEIKDFNPNGRAPMTASKKFLQDFAGSPLNRILKEALENKDWPLKYDLVSARDLVEALQPRLKTSETSMMVALKKFGPIDMGRCWVDGANKKLWAIRNQKHWMSKVNDLPAIQNGYRKPVVDPFSKQEGYIGENTAVKKDVPNY